METVNTNTQALESAIRLILSHIGENPEREGLIDTPKRMIKSWNKLFGGYFQNPHDIVRVFADGACDEMVALKDIGFYSTCEHHFLPFFGKIHIAYIPNGKVIGVSKLARIVEIYARRLQIQERLVSQIADCINDLLTPRGVMVVCEGQHFCMTSRGVEKQSAIMVTSAIRGVFTDSLPRSEFMSLIGRNV